MERTGYTASYYLALYQMRDDGTHHNEDDPRAVVTGIVLPHDDAVVRAQMDSAAASLTAWILEHRMLFDESVDDGFPVVHPQGDPGWHP